MAGPTVSLGAMTKCSFGVAPSSLIALPISMTMTDFMPAATVMDIAPGANILPFGMCMTPSNPMVAAATAAAFGVLTPMPCIPIPAGTWIPTTPNVLLAGQPVLTMDSMLCCAWGGMINILFPGEFNVISI